MTNKKVALISGTTVTLNAPLKEGDNEIKEVTIRKPMAGELRGIKLIDVMQIDTAAYEKLLPRITSPMLLESQVGQLDLSDLMQITQVVSGFFEAATPTT